MKTYFIIICLAIGCGLTHAATQTKLDPDKPTRFYMESYTDNEAGTADSTFNYDGCNSVDNNSGATIVNWQDGAGGYSSWTNREIFGSDCSGMETNDGYTDVYYESNTWPDVVADIMDTSQDDPEVLTDFPLEHCEIGMPAVDNSGTFSSSTFTATEKDKGNRHAETHMKLQTGGKAGSTRKNLFCISATATPVPCEVWPIEFFYLGEEPPMTYLPPILPQSIAIGSLGNLNSHGNKWIALPDNSPPIDVTPTVSGVDYYTFTEPTPTKYLSYFEIFVEPSSSNPFETGHAFWRLSTDVPEDALQHLSPSLTVFLGECKGFYPADGTSQALLGPPGKLQTDDPASAYITRKFYIGFPDLINGLEFTRGVSQSPPGYTLLVYDCVDCALDAGAHSNVKLGGQAGFPTWTPTDLAWYLALVYPGPWLNNPTIFEP